MNELYDELFQRWVRAFDETDQLSRYRDEVRTTKYARSYRYHIKEYTPKKFPSGGRLSDKPLKGAANPMSYGFDAAGRPVHVAYGHEYNKIYWEGCYRYAEDRVEYISFCTNTGVPNVVDMLQLADGKRTAYQSWIIDGGGAYMREGDVQAYIERVKEDINAVWCHIEKYIYEGDRIVGADCFDNSPGYGRREYRKKYFYSHDGKLDEIRSLYDDGTQAIVYAHVKKKTEMSKLVDGLARQMADAIVETLLKNNVEQPLALLDISYQQVGDYLPALIPVSLMEWESCIAQGRGGRSDSLILWPDVRNIIYMEPGDLERPLKQLMQIMWSKEDFEPGTKMLRKSAFLLTRGRLNGKIAVTEDFLAFAMDKSIEFLDEEKELLRDCGLTEEVERKWKEKGWLT